VSWTEVGIKLEKVEVSAKLEVVVGRIKVVA
jgi:hypothetical protein